MNTIYNQDDDAVKEEDVGVDGETEGSDDTVDDEDEEDATTDSPASE